MPSYIVCQKKRNNPRMDVRICEKKCDQKDTCNEYLSFHKLAHQEGSIDIHEENGSFQQIAA
ncbi:MAG: hypothetical protein JW882_07830 [Deltaproteobacteria bacterium]|nr:hypothetical protein [Deltaproteobacteria bacterium]